MPETTYHGYGLFPGIGAIVSASYTCSHGISPSCIDIECAPQPNLPSQGGDFLFFWGPVGNESIVVRVRDCRINNHSIQRTTQNLIWRLQIFDRRWKWQAGAGLFGPISGTYNVRLDDDTLDLNTVRAPQDLATLCLLAMGESAFDVSQLPNDSLPPIYWDRDNPARALASLCDSLGCRVILRMDNTVQIGVPGVGVLLADNLPIIEDSLGISPPQRPDSLAVVTGKSRYQDDFPLIPVGLDVDGTIKQIDDLSYTPNIGWPNVDPFNFGAVSNAPAANGIIPRDLARQTVWRWYQIFMPTDVFSLAGYGSDFTTASVDNPGLGAVDNFVVTHASNIRGTPIEQIRQVLPLEDEQVETYFEPVDVVGGVSGKVRTLKALVYGQYAMDDFGFGTSSPGTPFVGSYSIDKEKGIVIFGKPVFIRNFNQQGAGFTHSTALIFLRTAVSVHDPDSWAWDKMTVVGGYDYGLGQPGLGSWGTGPRILKHDELVFNCLASKFQTTLQNGLRVTNPFKTNSNDIAVEIRTNAPRVLTESNYYLAAANLEYANKFQQNRLYAGLYYATCDGAIQQVTWSVGPKGATTRISRNNEINPAVPPYRERRMFEELKYDELYQFKYMNKLLAYSKLHDGIGQGHS